jgi:hypothetical protein
MQTPANYENFAMYEWRRCLFTEKRIVLALSFYGKTHRPRAVQGLSSTPDIAADVLCRFTFNRQNQADLLE